MIFFYREAGPKDAKKILLLHGYPSSSFMFRNHINDLKDKYHVIALDYPGFGFSGFPDTSVFEYTFGNISKVVEHFADSLVLRKSFNVYTGLWITGRYAVDYPATGIARIPDSTKRECL